MVLLRRVIGDALRSRRQGQHRTLREVSTAANVSLGYLSEIERGQKEASSELLSAICEALGAQLSELLREVSDTVALAEQMDGVLVPVGGDMPDTSGADPSPARRNAGPVPRGPVDRAAALRAPRPVAEPRRPVRREDETVRNVATDGTVSVSVRQDTPLKATLRATRTSRSGRGRDVVCVA
jgi:transcriptional regulator with XRE-family HTH domain